MNARTRFDVLGKPRRRVDGRAKATGQTKFADDVVLPRMVHASDWPFPPNAMVFWHRLHPFTLVRLISEKNLFLRDILLKQALGMPPQTFIQAARLFDSNDRKAMLRNEKNSKTNAL